MVKGLACTHAQLAQNADHPHSSAQFEQELKRSWKDLFSDFLWFLL